MKIPRLVCLLTLLFISADFPPPDLSTIQEQDLEGRWDSVTLNGGHWLGHQWIINGSKLVILTRGRQAFAGTISLNPQALPHTFDIQFAKETMCGIYQITGNELKICCVYNNKQRPQRFDAGGGTVLVLKLAPPR